MDYTQNLVAMRERGRHTANLLLDQRLVLCLGNRAALTVFAGSSRSAASVVGAATTAAEGEELVERLHPTLLVVSDGLESGDGISLLVTLKARQPDLRVLLLVSRMQRWAKLQEAISAGCEGVVPESRLGHGAGLAALQAIFGGGIYIDRNLRGLIQGPPPGHGPLAPLSRREREVLSLVAQGCGNAEIGATLYLSVDTVKTHLQSVLRKLPARDRTHAAVLGVCWDLIDWPKA